MSDVAQYSMSASEFDTAVSYYKEQSLWSDNALKIQKTWIPGCDFWGLFANKAIKKGELVCKYTGVNLKTKEALKLEDKSYLMRLGQQCYIDARPCPMVYARYINDCINPCGWNVEFKKCPQAKCAYVVALRDILPNEEIFVDYGKWYWLSLKPNKMSITEIRRRIKDCCDAEI